MHDARVTTVLEHSLAELHKFEVRWFRGNVKNGDEISDLHGKPKPGKKEHLQHRDLKSSHVLSAQHGASQVLSSAEAQDVMKSAQFEDEVKETEKKDTPREPGIAPEGDECDMKLASLAGGVTEDDDDDDSAGSSACLIEPNAAWVNKQRSKLNNDNLQLL